MVLLASTISPGDLSLAACNSCESANSTIAAMHRLKISTVHLPSSWTRARLRIDVTEARNISTSIMPRNIAAPPSNAISRARAGGTVGSSRANSTVASKAEVSSRGRRMLRLMAWTNADIRELFIYQEIAERLLARCLGQKSLEMRVDAGV